MFEGVLLSCLSPYIYTRTGRNHVFEWHTALQHGAVVVVVFSKYGSLEAMTEYL